MAECPTGKIPYGSRRHALEVATHHGRKGGDGGAAAFPYLCECGSWHLSSMRRSVFRRRRRKGIRG